MLPVAAPKNPVADHRHRDRNAALITASGHIPVAMTGNTNDLAPVPAPANVAAKRIRDPSLRSG
jgi:hypothetical protein